TLGLKEHYRLCQRQDVSLQASSVISSPIQTGAQDPDFLLQFFPLVPEELQLSPCLPRLILQLLHPLPHVVPLLGDLKFHYSLSLLSGGPRGAPRSIRRLFRGRFLETFPQTHPLSGAGALLNRRRSDVNYDRHASCRRHRRSAAHSTVRLHLAKVEYLT
ncbi:hypothetical protein B296_00008954, partial [Ensete ventricosum]